MLKQIFVSDEGSPHGKRPMLLAELPIELLRVPQLAPKIVKVLRSNDPDAKIIRSCYADMVQNVLKLTLQDHGTEELSIPIAKIFGMLIGFFPVSESLRALDVILQQPNEALHLEVLRSFATTTNTAQSGDSESRDTCFKLLPTLVSVVERSQDPQLKKSGISCLNCIIKKYGKTNTSKTLEIAAFITGPTCLQSDDVDIQIAALDTIRTMVIVLGESIVPICPVIISNSLNYLSSAIGKEHWNIDLHNAVYSSLIVLFSTVPWMITGNELDRFLELSYKSASNSTDKSCDKIRVEGLDALARNCAPQTCLVALLRNWNKAVGTPGSASGEHLQILETVIRKHSKATIVSNVTTIVDHFMEIMNYRASRVSIDFQVHNDAEVLKVENTASSILIATIYKLNDTHFRPQFIRMSEWASRSKSKNESTRIRNLISWFSFLHKFFNTLQVNW